MAHGFDECSVLGEDARKLKLVGRLREARPIEYAFLMCIDGNFCVKARHDLRASFGVRYDPDLTSIPGGAYGISLPRRWWNLRAWFWWLVSTLLAWRGIWIAVHRHGVRTVVLASHEDCGAVALDGHRFEDEQDERGFHKECLIEVCRRFRWLFPGVRFHGVFVHVREVDDKPFVQLDRVY